MFGPPPVTPVDAYPLSLHDDERIVTSAMSPEELQFQMLRDFGIDSFPQCFFSRIALDLKQRLSHVVVHNLEGRPSYSDHRVILESDTWMLNDLKLSKYASRLIGFVCTLLIMFQSAIGAPKKDHTQIKDKKASMSLLHIALQDGFTGDEIIIKVNGQEVFNKKDVKTNFVIGRAEVFELDVNKGLLNIEITIASRQLSMLTALDLSHPIYLGISVTQENQFQIRVSERPFGYL